jgi:hypothetical protein
MVCGAVQLLLTFLLGAESICCAGSPPPLTPAEGTLLWPKPQHHIVGGERGRTYSIKTAVLEH